MGLLVVGLLFSMGFANKQQGDMKFESIDVNIDHTASLHFLDTKDIKKLIYNTGDSIKTSRKSDVNIPAIETSLNQHQNIENAELYATIDGKLKVKITQRKPILRIINKHNNSFYIDGKGAYMPLSDKYTAKVLVANGNINSTIQKKNRRELNDSLAQIGIIGQLFAIAKYIKADSLWNAQITQLYVNNNNDIELIPLLGNHTIIFGDTTNMDVKFNKLFTFYTEGLNTTGWWNKYSKINLKFNKQIVCTKK